MVQRHEKVQCAIVESVQFIALNPPSEAVHYIVPSVQALLNVDVGEDLTIT